jgi:hypothetical protein
MGKDYDAALIATLPEEIQQILNINSTVPGSTDKQGMPTVEEVDEDRYTDPTNECSKLMSEVVKKHLYENKLLRARVAELLKRKGCPSTVTPYDGDKSKLKCFTLCGGYDGIVGKKTTGGSSNVVDVLSEAVV